MKRPVCTGIPGFYHGHIAAILNQAIPLHLAIVSILFQNLVLVELFFLDAK